MAGISRVFTISRVAEMLGEDENLLQEISIDMDPEDGRLIVLGPGEETITAFTHDGVDNLTELRQDGQSRSRPAPALYAARVTSRRSSPDADGEDERNGVIRAGVATLANAAPSSISFTQWSEMAKSDVSGWISVARKRDVT